MARAATTTMGGSWLPFLGRCRIFGIVDKDRGSQGGVMIIAVSGHPFFSVGRGYARVCVGKDGGTAGGLVHKCHRLKIPASLLHLPAMTFC